MNTRGLPGTFAPRYQLLQDGYKVMSATALTNATHSVCSCSVVSMVDFPEETMCEMQSEIHSTCCSMDIIMLVNTEGLPGPDTMNMFGKPAVLRPR